MTPIPDKLIYTMDHIHSVTGLDKFIVYGSFPLDSLLGVPTTSDIDIAVEGLENESISKVVHNLVKNKYEIVQNHRKYTIHLNKRVILVYAENEEHFLDIAFLEDIKLIGHFNLETLYFRYPELDYVDPYHALQSVKTKQIFPIRELTLENPFLLTGRLLRLCTKYKINFKNQTVVPIIENLKNCLVNFKSRENWKSVTFYSGLSSILKALVKIKENPQSLPELISSGLIQLSIPGLQTVDNTTLIKALIHSRTKAEIVQIFLNSMPKENKKEFLADLKELGKRSWDKEDMACGHITNNLRN